MQVCTIARARATIGGPMRESRTPCNAATFHCTTTLSLALAWPIAPIGQIRTATISKDRKNKGSLDVDVDGRRMLAAIVILPPAIVGTRIHANYYTSCSLTAPRRAGYRLRLAAEVILSVPQGEGFFSTSGEQSAVALVTNLREVANSRCWVSNELEAIFWRWRERRLRLWCHHRYSYGGRVLDEIALEGRPVAERRLLRYALPFNAERFQESAYQSQGVKGV